MKALVGVDYRNGYRESLDQLEFLQFPKLQLTLLHAMGSRSFGNGMSEPAMEYSGVFHGVLEREAANLLGSAHNLSSGRFQSVTTFLSRRAANEALSEEAEVTNSDLIALTPTVRANSDRPFGSTTHSILEKLSSSILISRPRAMSKLKVGVVVTDSNETTEQLFKKLLAAPPCGVEELHVFELQNSEEVLATSTAAVSTKLRESSNQLDLRVDQLRNLGFASTGQLSVDRELRSVLSFAEEKGAGLLISGTPHGNLSFISRALASSTDHSALIYV